MHFLILSFDTNQLEVQVAQLSNFAASLLLTVTSLYVDRVQRCLSGLGRTSLQEVLEMRILDGRLGVGSCLCRQLLLHNAFGVLLACYGSWLGNLDGNLHDMSELRNDLLSFQVDILRWLLIEATA